MIYCLAYPSQKPRWFYAEAIKEYEKRLGRFCKVQRMMRFDAASERDLIIAVSPYGKYLSSEEMAGRFLSAEHGAVSRVIFTSKLDSFARYDEKWALTSVNIPDDLQMVLLLEQIYRAQKIMHNEPYHK